jgi:hypothetical protein
MSTFIDRLQVERTELQDKTEKLSAFINSENFEALVSPAERELLAQQLVVMNQYAEILTQRISLDRN